MWRKHGKVCVENKSKVALESEEKLGDKGREGGRK